MSDYKYKAFISYRHMDFDKKIAEKLQKMLESYKPPRELRDLKDNWRVFRDETELPTSSDLSDDIRTALKESEYLIVICSPDTPKSRWCLEEITQFKALHGNTTENIISLLIDGEPSESFPSELCRTVVQVRDEHGNEKYQETTVEPLAANISSDSEQKAMSKLKIEFLRIVAPMLGCGYDDLYDRSRRSRIRRITFGTAAAFTVLAMFALYSNLMLMRVYSEKRSAEANLIRSGANESELLLMQNNTIGAISSVLNAIPDKHYDNESIYIAENALANALRAFEEHLFVEQRVLEHKSPIQSIGYVGKEGNIVTEDSKGIYLWDRSTGKKIKEFLNEDDLSKKRIIGFENNGVIQKGSGYHKASDSFIMTGDGLVSGYMKDLQAEERISSSDFYIREGGKIYKLSGESGETIWEWQSEDDWSTPDVSYNNNILFASVNDELYVIDDTTGKIKTKYGISGLKQDPGSGFSFNEVMAISDKHCYIKNQNDIKKSNIIALTIDSDTLNQQKTLISSVDHEYKYVDAAQNIDGVFYTLFSSDEGVFGMAGSTCYLEAYSDDTLEREWSYKFSTSHGNGINKIGKINASDSGSYTDIIFAVADDKLALFEQRSGKLIKEYSLDGAAKELYYSIDGMIYVITSGGSEILINTKNITSDKTEFIMLKTHVFDKKPELCSYYNNSYAVVSDADSLNVYIYEDKTNPDFDKIFEGADSIKSMDLNDDGSCAVINTYKELYLYRFDDKSVKQLTQMDKFGGTAKFLTNDKILIIDNSIYIYDLTTGTKNMINDKSGVTDEEKVFTAGDRAIICTDNKLLFIDGNGGVTEFSGDKADENAYGGAYRGYIESFSLSDNEDKYAVYIDHYKAIPGEIEIRTLDPTAPVSLDCAAELGEKALEVIDIDWLSDKKIAVLYSDYSLGVYNTSDGSRLCTWAVGDMLPYDPVCIMSTGENDIGIICSDAGMYRFNISDGLKEDSIDLRCEDIRKMSTSKTISEHFKKHFLGDGNMLLSYDNYLWVINVKAFKLRYSTDGYLCYDVRQNKIGKKAYNKIGFYPLYTTEQLIDKAKGYLQSVN